MYWVKCLPLDLERLDTDDLISQLALGTWFATFHMLELQANCHALLDFACVLGSKLGSLCLHGKDITH